MKEPNIIKVYIDESGSIHLNNKFQYFVIGGYHTEKKHDLLLKNNFKRTLEQSNVQQESNNEVKASSMSIELQKNCYQNLLSSKMFYPSALIFDKHQMEIKIKDCNTFHHYAIQQYLDLCILQFLNDENEYRIDLQIDKISLKNYDTLSNHLNVYYVFKKNIIFNVYYYDSRDETGIQIADLVVNNIYCFYRKYEKPISTFEFIKFGLFLEWKKYNE